MILPAASSHLRRPAVGARLACVLALLGGLAAGAAPAAEPVAAPLISAKLRLLFASSLIQNVNRNDALVAFKLWVDSVGRNRGFRIETDTDSYDRLDEVAKRLREKTLDLVVFTTADYFEFAERGPLQPVFTPARNELAQFDEYVVLTRRDRALGDIPSLRGKSVAFFRFGGDLGRRWMEVTLGEGGLGSIDGFFGAQSAFSKASAVVLPVFFGKADAAVVNGPGWETMQELNPQLTQQLQVVARSPRLPQSVICLHEDYAGVRADLLAGLADLHKEPRGQQILLVFKMGMLHPFKPEHLESVRELIARPSKRAQPGGGEKK